MGCRFVCGQPRLCRDTGIYDSYYETGLRYDLEHVFENSNSISCPRCNRSSWWSRSHCGTSRDKGDGSPNGTREGRFYPITNLNPKRFEDWSTSGSSLTHKLLYDLFFESPFIWKEYFPSELPPRITEHVRSVLTALKANGANIVPVSLPSTSYALSSYYVLASAEASSNMARYDGIQYGEDFPCFSPSSICAYHLSGSYVKPVPGTNLGKTSNVYAQTRTAGFGLEVQKRILLGTYSLSAE